MLCSGATEAFLYVVGYDGRTVSLAKAWCPSGVSEKVVSSGSFPYAFALGRVLLVLSTCLRPAVLPSEGRHGRSPLRVTRVPVR